MSEIDRSRPIHLIVNPKSGYGGRKLLVAELRGQLRRAGYKAVEYRTRCPRDATRYARQVADEAGLIIVWGGDGTANEVATGLAGSDVPMLPCPAGTENLLATELKVPSNPRSIAGVLRDGQVLSCDVGRVNDRNFLMIIGIGFDAEVVRRLTGSRRGHISHLSYFWPIWRTFWEHNFPHLRITAEGREIFNDRGLAFVGNISRYAVGLRICRDAVFNDGLLDLVVFSCRAQTALVLHAAWTLLRRHPLKGNVLYRRVRDVHIETDTPVATQIDGDLGPSTPLDVSLCSQRVKLLIPRPRPWGAWPWEGDLL